MANTDRPRGAEPWGELKRVNEYTAAGAIGIGDLVKKEAAGKVEVIAASGSQTDIACIGVAITSADADGDKVIIADHPDQEYRIQADGADIDAQTDIGLNYGVVATARDSGTKQSRHELDSSSGATDATETLKLLQVDKTEGNALGANVDCVVKINNHQLAGGTGTAGV